MLPEDRSYYEAMNPERRSDNCPGCTLVAVIAVIAALVALAVLFLACSAPAKAATLTVHQPWSSSTFGCTSVEAYWAGSFGRVDAVCHVVVRTRDQDHLLDSGFDEVFWGEWRYVVTGDLHESRDGCSLAYSSPGVALVICGQGR